MNRKEFEETIDKEIVRLNFRKAVSKHFEDSSPCWLGESVEAQIERTIGQQPEKRQLPCANCDSTLKAFNVYFEGDSIIILECQNCKSKLRLNHSISQQPVIRYRVTNSFGGHVNVDASDLNIEIQSMLENGIEPSNIKIEVVTGDNKS